MSENLHLWDVSPREAARLQSEMRERLILGWDSRPISTVGGVDVSTRTDAARAAIVVLGYPELVPIEASTAETPLSFPYIPGLLAFREGPAILDAWARLQQKPDLLIFDGQGIAHPRGIGIASLMGLWLERPTIGAAKSRLFGRHAEVGPERGAHAPLLDGTGRLIGTVLRTRTGTKPIYVSPGHLIDVPRATDFVLDCCTRYRLPEPTRWAHRVAGGATLPGGESHQPRMF